MISLPFPGLQKTVRKLQSVRTGEEQASTEFEVMEQFAQCSWLSINLKTGKNSPD
ncbi:MAG: hypothetical protein U5N58_15340 [Actinomycetota bacterium]|nr:hypothetical protein [Actinomycetota bacterium]